MAVSYNAKKNCKKLDLFFDCDGEKPSEAEEEELKEAM